MHLPLVPEQREDRFHESFGRSMTLQERVFLQLGDSAADPEWDRQKLLHAEIIRRASVACSDSGRLMTYAKRVMAEAAALLAQSLALGLRLKDRR